MRVAYVCADAGVPVFGRKGCSIHVQEVVRALLAQEATVELIAARCGGSPPPDLQDVPVHLLHIDAEAGDAALRERASVRANAPLRSMLDALGPFDAVYERYSLWSWAGMSWAQRSGVPGILEVNAPLIDEQAEHRMLRDRTTALRVARRTFAAAHIVTAVSLGVAEWVGGLCDAAHRVHVVPNGVDPARFTPGSYPHDPARWFPQTDVDRFVIGFVGTLKAWHGLPTLVDAFAELHAADPATRLLIVGQGPERQALEERLADLELQEATVFTGAVAAHEVPGLLASMDVAVAPYPARDDFYFSPLKVLEYMAAGVPIVASRIGQIPELITHDHTGLLCAPGDAPALAAAVRRLRRSPALRARLGAAAKAVATREHTWRQVTRRTFALAGLHLPTVAAPWHGRSDAEAPS